jgi:hypothetical protein
LKSKIGRGLLLSVVGGGFYFFTEHASNFHI